MKISIFGCGAMGCALGNVLADNGHDVLIYGRNGDEINYLNHYHENPKYLKNKKINESIIASNILKEAVDFSNVYILAVPSKAIIDVSNSINTILNKEVFVINAAKGLSQNVKNTLQNSIISSFKGHINGISSILGPGFASEIIDHNITCVCAVSSNLNDSLFTQNLFSNSYFRVYQLNDVIGAELGSSLKNVIAIGSGILNGLGYGENSKAALITRGLVEIGRIGEALGANQNTFFGLTGIGDLILTCNSFTSRNFSFGYEVGKMDDASLAIKQFDKTVEGLEALKFIYEFNRESIHLDLPIINYLFETLYLYKKPSDMIKCIMSRPLKKE